MIIHEQSETKLDVTLSKEDGGTEEEERFADQVMSAFLEKADASEHAVRITIEILV